MAQLHDNPVSQKAAELIQAIETFPPAPEATYLTNLAVALMDKVNVYEQRLKGLSGHQWRDEAGDIHGL